MFRLGHLSQDRNRLTNEFLTPNETFPVLAHGTTIMLCIIIEYSLSFVASFSSWSNGGGSQQQQPQPPQQQQQQQPQQQHYPTNNNSPINNSQSAFLVGTSQPATATAVVTRPAPVNNNNKTMTAAMFAQTKFGSTKLKTHGKRSNRLSPTENFTRGKLSFSLQLP